MSSGEVSCDHDYLIYDSNGVRKVKDGVESPATEDDLPKNHQDSGCTECAFVANSESIFVSSSQKNQCKRGIIIKLGLFTKPKWVGHLIHYAFQCSNCGHISVDYGHGYRLYITCNSCNTNRLLARRFYAENGLQPPPTFINLMMIFMRYRFFRKTN